MNTSVLSESELKKTLSAKKKSKKCTIKNVLVTPYCNYWPLLNSDDASLLLECLRENLTKLRSLKFKIPWSELKSVSRHNRKEARLQYIKANLVEQKVQDKAGIVLGVNEVTKLLEADGSSSILITEEVSPRLMVKHIIDMAVLKNVPILIVPSLKSTLKDKVGIASIVLALRKNSNPQLGIINKKIKDIFTNYSVPSDHVNFNNDDYNLDVAPSNGQSSLIEIEQPTCVKDCNLYLYRNSKAERTFVPELSKKQENLHSFTEMKVDDCGFVGFSDNIIKNPTENIERKGLLTKNKISYKSLLIKRVTNNKNREKKKIDMLKKI